MKLQHIHESEERSILVLRGKQPHTVDYFYCANDKLTSLEGGPTIVQGEFRCSSNLLKTLKFGPTEVYGNFYCGYNQLETFDGFPVIINGLVNVCKNNFTSFKGIHKQIKKMNGAFRCTEGPPIKSHVLGLLLIEGITLIRLDAKWLENILNKYVGRPDKKKAMLECQQELIELGHDDLAQL